MSAPGARQAAPPQRRRPHDSTRLSDRSTAWLDWSSTYLGKSTRRLPVASPNLRLPSSSSTSCRIASSDVFAPSQLTALQRLSYNTGRGFPLSTYPLLDRSAHRFLVFFLFNFSLTCPFPSVRLSTVITTVRVVLLLIFFSLPPLVPFCPRPCCDTRYSTQKEKGEAAKRGNRNRNGSHFKRSRIFILKFFFIFLFLLCFKENGDPSGQPPRCW